MRDDNNSNQPRGGRGHDRHRQSQSHWPDDDLRSPGEAGVYGADAHASPGGPRHGGREDDDNRHYRRDRHEGPYAPDEYAHSETGGRSSAWGRTGHDYDDHRAREFDSRAMALQHERERRLDDIGPYARESGRSFGPRRRGYVAEDGLERADFGRGREFDYLPGSFGYGGEYRRDLSAVPGRFGYDGGHSAYGPGAGQPGMRGRSGDASGSPDHRGRGPKGYARSDERILDDINERLCEDALIDASDIEVRCEQGKVVLGGRVDARWIKHRAEDIVDVVSGVKDIENRIRVGTGGDVEAPRVARETPAATRGAQSRSSSTGRNEGASDHGERRDPPPQQPH